LEDRRLLASITVSNSTDLTNADTTSITALIANDGGDGISLREAITAANNTAGDDVITFDGGVFFGGPNSLIRLTQGELEVTETLTIDASLAMDVTITGDANGDDATVAGTFITDVAASFGGTAGAADDLLDDNSRVINFSDTSSDLNLLGLSLTGGRTTEDNQFIPDQGFDRSNSGGGINFASSGLLTLTNSTLSGSSTAGDQASGGGIYVRSGDVMLTGSTLSGNTTAGLSSAGGGIAAVYGDVTLTDSTLSGNRTANAGGGGIATVSGNVTLTNSTLSGNSTAGYFAEGGGILSFSGDVTLTNSTLTGNSTAGDQARGGGVSTRSGDVTLTNSTLSGNSTVGNLAFGGGISAIAGDVTLIRSTLSANNTVGFDAPGGGILTNYGDVTLFNSTLTGNSTAGDLSEGGGIRTSAGSATLINSTVSGNSTSGNDSPGGGIRTYTGDVTLTNSTLTANSTAGAGGGIFVVDTPDGVPAVTFENSIVAGNMDNGTAPNFQSDPDGTVTVNNSLISDTTGSGITPETGSGNILDQPALLGPLADNGGPTLTHALLAGSPAIDAGSDTLAVDADGVSITTDQRGTGFDRSNFGRVDIGAFESAFDAAPIVPTVLSTTINEGGILARPDLWNTLSVTFDSEVMVAAGNLSLFNDSTGGTPVNLSGIGFSFDSSTNTATWDFTTLAAPLDAAFYSHQLDAGSINFDGLSLDGNGDGTGGDDFIAQHYVAIPGDANLDGVVDVLGDALSLVGNLNSTTNLAWADGNFNGDSVVSVLGDAIVLVGNLGHNVRPLPALFVSSSANAVTTSLALTSSNDAEELDEAIAGAYTPAQSPSLVLAGDHDLRDDVFGSDF